MAEPTPKSVAKISETTLKLLGVDKVFDANGNLVVNLDFGDVLEVSEFEAIAFEPAAGAIIPPPRNRKPPKSPL